MTRARRKFLWKEMKCHVDLKAYLPVCIFLSFPAGMKGNKTLSRVETNTRENPIR